MEDEFALDPLAFESLAELTFQLKQSVLDDSQEDFVRILGQSFQEFFKTIYFSKTFRQIERRSFDDMLTKILEQMPEKILKAWSEKPQVREKIEQIVLKGLPKIIDDIPDNLKSDPDFLMALRWLGSFPFYGFITIPLEHVLRSMAWKSGRLGPTLEHAVKALFMVDDESYGFFIKDAGNRYVYVNKAMELLLERPKSEIEGRTDAELYEKKDAEVLAGEFEEALQGSLISRARMRRIGQKNKALLELFVAKRDPWDRPVGIYGICREVTGSESSVELAAIPDNQYPSLAMRKVLAECLLEAETDSIVLLTGETGSGKGYLAKFIHEHSRRSKGDFWTINMVGIPETLFESELFGYEKGAHDKAHEPKPGQLELAPGGTLLLDEIGEVPLSLQVKLLTCLEDKEFLRLGGRKKVKIDGRIIAATNKNLYRAVDENNFRKDLLYRINTSTIRVPSLRERLEDIPVLVKELIPGLAQNLSVPAPASVSVEAIERLCSHDWPGNVRELKSVLEHAVKIARGKTITPSMIRLGQEAVSQEVSEEVEGLDYRSHRPIGYGRDNEIDLARDIFQGLSNELQGRHLDIMVNQLCEGRSGAVSCVCRVLKISDKTVKERLKLVKAHKKLATGNPGIGFRDRMEAKPKRYLVDEVLKLAR